MSAAIERVEPGRASEWAAVAAGVFVLTLRAYVPFGVPVLATIYLALASLSVAPSAFDGTARIHPVLVAALGFAGVLVAGWAGGPALPAATVTATAVGLNLLAAVGEEAFFRRFLYDRLARWGPTVAVACSAGTFAAVHVPAYGWAAFPVDLGAGVLLGWQRWASGTWLAPAATHAFANLVVMFR